MTDLEVDFYLVVDPSEAGISGVNPVRLDTDRFNHETRIEADMFGTKASAAPDCGVDETIDKPESGNAEGESDSDKSGDDGGDGSSGDGGDGGGGQSDHGPAPD